MSTKGGVVPFPNKQAQIERKGQLGCEHVEIITGGSDAQHLGEAVNVIESERQCEQAWLLVGSVK